ncbi:MAG: amidase [Gemmataceae bacterium]|nr:amidase [Gemmataceae bacterium]
MHRRAFLAAALAAAARAAAPPTDPTRLTLAQASRLVRAGTLSPVKLAEACLARIVRLDGRLSAFVTVTGTQAVEQARAAEKEIGAGKWRGPLHGLPIGIKDNLDVAGVRTTAGDPKRRWHVPKEDADAVRRLREAGAVFVGKLNMNTYAIGYDSVNSFAGPVRNPWDADRIAGGSSGGSGAAVAAGMCLASLGTDTGGSVRHPAACCNLVGLKPTHGRVSLRGVVPLLAELDCVGPLARTAEDCALVLDAIAERGGEKAGDVRKLRLGRPKGHFHGLDPETKSLVGSAIEELATLTAGVEDVAMPRHHRKPKETLEGMRKVVALEGVEVLATPTVSHPPHPVAEAQKGLAPGDPGRHLAPFNQLGWPGVSVPCGFTKAGLPVGVQLVAGPGHEARLLVLAAAYQRVTAWHERRR